MTGNFTKITADAKARLRLESEIAADGYTLLPDGRNRKCCCPFHMEKTPSFKVQIEKQFFHCFGCGAQGDVLNWISFRLFKKLESNGAEFVAVLRDACARAGIEFPERGNESRPARVPSKPKAIYPTTEELRAAAERQASMRGEILTQWNEYVNPLDDAIELVTIRLECNDNKRFLQAVPVVGGFSFAGIKSGKNPLFNRRRVAASQSVLVVEGEKCVLALEELGIVATTSPGGAKAAKKADWTPLTGKNVTIWPDNDTNGNAYAADAVSELRKLSLAPTMNLIDPKPLNLGDGGDVVDFLAGIQGDDVAKIDAVAKIIDSAQAIGSLAEHDAVAVPATDATEPPEAPESMFRWPAIVDVATALQSPTPRPDELIKHIAFVGAKISLSSTSKGHKTFIQIDLAHSVATGTPWMGHGVKRGRVLYINLELLPYSFETRHAAIAQKKGIAPEPGMFEVLHLRGYQVTIEQLQQYLRRQIGDTEYALIIVDPLYKLLGGRSENDASEMGGLLNCLEAIAHHAGAAIVVAHHFAKGSAAGKAQLDRSSGSGVVGRDGDAIITLTDHEEENCVTFEVTVRDFPPVPATVMKWVFPCFEPRAELDPRKLKKATNQLSPVTQADILAEVSESLPQQRQEIIEKVITKTGRGEKAVRDAFNKTKHLLIEERLKRSGTSDLFRYTRKETVAIVARPAIVSCHDLGGDDGSSP